MKIYKTLFVTGTDTGIGKTYSCLEIAKNLISQGKKVAYFKPIQTGCSEKDLKDNWLAPDVEFMKENCPQVFSKYLYAYELAATPQLAAEQVNEIIDFEKIKTELINLEQKFDHVLVEGAGGLIVPVAPNKTMANLISFLNLPALLVSGNRLGTINQTCLSVHYALSLNINLIGFIFSGLPPTSETLEKVSKTNAAFIENYASCKFLSLQY